MLVRYLKAQFMVLLCGGMVGPIFLAVYFALGAQPLLKWMFWTGLAVTALDVLVALWLVSAGTRNSARSAALEQHGVLAVARIVGMAETGTRVNGRPLVRLTLRIDGPGLSPFTTEDRVLGSVTRMPMLTSGRLVVRVLPGTQDYDIDWNRSALISGAAPAVFTLDEDGRSYDLSGQTEPLMEIMRLLKDHGIPLSSTIDIRSDPAVRQQIMAIVRRAAAPPEPAPVAAPSVAPEAPGMPPVAPPPQRSIAERLQELETLRAMGTISDDEYTARRTQILSEI